MERFKRVFFSVMELERQDFDPGGSFSEVLLNNPRHLLHSFKDNKVSYKGSPGKSLELAVGLPGSHLYLLFRSGFFLI